MSQIKVRIKDSIFPVRINGARYLNGDELVVDEKDFSEKIMDIVEEIDHQAPPENEFEGKSVEELKAYAEENGIDIGRASTEEGIIKKIIEAQQKTE